MIVVLEHTIPIPAPTPAALSPAAAASAEDLTRLASRIASFWRITAAITLILQLGESRAFLKAFPGS
jgi:hypothetical protein